MHGVAIGFEIGVGMGTFSLEESGWELGGIGFTSKLAITNSKYLICNRNHKSQWEHLSHCMHMQASTCTNAHQNSKEMG